MRPLLRHVALLFGLAGLCLGTAAGLELGRIFLWSGHPAGFVADIGSSDVSSSDVTGSIGSTDAQRLPLTDKQRGTVFDDIMKLADAPIAHVAAPDTATTMPNSVALQELPESATRDVPLVQGYKFVKLDDRILLVSPSDRSIVAEMPRYHTVLQ